MARENVLFYLFYNFHPVSRPGLNSSGTLEANPEDMDDISRSHGLAYDKDYSYHLILSDGNPHRSPGKAVWQGLLKYKIQ